VFPVPRMDTAETFAWWQGAFTEQELDKLQNIAKKAEMKGEIGRGEVNNHIRETDLYWVGPEEKYLWVYQKLGRVVAEVNTKYFGFDIDGFNEPLQFCNYKAKKKGHYTYHVDRGPYRNGVRKLTVVVQLSDPDTYKGGELLLKTADEDTVASNERGMITMFPSWTLHKVTPVTKGSRQSLVAWITGPPFK